jgi:hypothetical protein
MGMIKEDTQVCTSYFVYHTEVCLLLSSLCDYMMCTSAYRVYILL